MIRYAAKTIRPCDKSGTVESNRRIDIGDKCTVTALPGICPVTYPAGCGSRSAFLPTLRGMAAFYNQNDYKRSPYPAPGYATATIKSGGCGPTSMAMIVETLCPGEPFDPVASAAFARQCGARVSGGTDMVLLSRKAAEKFGLILDTTNAMSELRAHLSRGGIAIANVAGRGMFSTGGHYIVVLAEEGGLLTIADPGLYAGKYGLKYPKRRANVKVCGNLLRAAPDVLDADCVGRNPRYYLFKK